MSRDYCAPRPLFGGAITATFPLRFEDVSNVRPVPDHQEVLGDPERDESLIFELLDLKLDVADNGSATWFLQDLATEQDAEQVMIIQQSGVIEFDGLRLGNMPAVVTTAVGQMAISKEGQGREAQNIVRVYLANLRLREVGTDVLITAYEPILISPLSDSASTVGAGLAVPAAQSGCVPMAEVFQLAVSSFKKPLFPRCPQTPTIAFHHTPSDNLMIEEKVKAEEVGEASHRYCEFCVEKKEADEMFRIDTCSHSFCSHDDVQYIKLFNV